MSASFVSPRIKFIFDAYYASAAKEKFIQLFAEYQEYVENHIKLDDKFTASISDIDLMRAIDSYYLDVIRYKEYHLKPTSSNIENISDLFTSEWVDSVHAKKINFQKIASFTAKWLLKANVIQITRYNGFTDELSEEENRIIAFANVSFILQHVLGIIDVDAKDVPADFLYELIYNFKFRNYDENHYVLIFGILARAYGKKENEQ